MEKLTLKVDTGAVTVDVENENGKKIGEFEFVPTDTDIVNRYGSVVEFFNNVSFNENEGNEEIVKKFSSQIRDQFDHLFNYPVSDSIFSKCGPLTPVQNGDFFFEVVLDGIRGIIENVTNERVEKKMKKIRKATAKYHVVK
ncbi:MAG: hypothetical protein ACLTY8_02845 [Lachnospiraceae bacterium]